MTTVQIQNKNGEFLKEVLVEPWKILLSQLEAAGVEIPNACRAGMCAACMCNITAGGEYVKKDMRWEPAFPLWEDEIMTCIGGVLDTQETIILKTMY